MALSRLAFLLAGTLPHWTGIEEFLHRSRSISVQPNEATMTQKILKGEGRLHLWEI